MNCAMSRIPFVSEGSTFPLNVATQWWYVPIALPPPILFLFPLAVASRDRDKRRFHSSHPLSFDPHSVDSQNSQRTLASYGTYLPALLALALLYFIFLPSMTILYSTVRPVPLRKTVLVKQSLIFVACLPPALPNFTRGVMVVVHSQFSRCLLFSVTREGTKHNRW